MTDPTRPRRMGPGPGGRAPDRFADMGGRAQPYTSARCAECRAPATREPATGAWSIKARDHDPACAAGQRELLASVHVDHHGMVTRKATGRLVGYVDRYKGNRTIAQQRGGPWRWVLDGGESSPVCYPTRRAALLAMLRNPRAR